ncbi:helix-turn-helix domain-containing protein [Salinibacterium sp. PAMC 21357]|uniref:helix-turn-helix domain-containing protein n=1 Tax=Salinibacterium sp. PAMC 21357 TaxID=1112215 RepID=UPI000287D9B8|nr:helix-turn-helix transcriptional regulator [Salinibacterium sp. PAMC 21357]
MTLAAETIRTARIRAGISQAALARRAGIAQSTISRIEHEEIDPTWSTMQSLLAATGWEINPQPTSAAQLLSPTTVSRAMTESLRKSDSESAIRDLAEGVGRLIRTGEAGENLPQWAIAQPSKPIGIPLWDTFLATAFAYGLERAGQTPPQWMLAVPALPHETSPGDDPGPEFRDWLRARTPQVFLDKNILSRAEDWAIA